MDTDLGQLVGAFQAYFLDLYKQAKPASGAPAQPASAGRAQPFLAFEAVGVPMSAEMFALKSGEFDTGLLTQQFSLCANAAPALDGQILRGGGLLTLDGLYDLLLTEAAPAAAGDLDSFGHIKRAAQEAFTNAESSYSIPGMEGVFHAASPSPADFPAPSGDACWTRHSFEQSSTTQTTAAAASPGPAAAAPARPLPNWGWRMAAPEMAGMLHQTPVQMMAAMPHAVTPPPARPMPPHVGSPLVMRPLPPGRPGAPIAPLLHANPSMAGMLARSVVLPPRTVPAPSPAPAAVHPVFRADLMRAQMQQMTASATVQATTTKRFTLSFDYCLVSAARPWLSGSLLTAGNWYVPHMAAGQIASGSGEGSGIFEALPMAALMVRNLVIEGDWSDADREAMHSSLNFGPFSLMGRSINTVKSTLSSPGMQLVAWVLEPLPCLPPVGDPGLSASTSASVGTAAPMPSAADAPAAITLAPSASSVAPVASTPSGIATPTPDLPVPIAPFPTVQAAPQSAPAA